MSMGKTLLGLAVGALVVGIAVAAAGGGDGLYPTADYDRDAARFAQTRWTGEADRLAQELTDPYDVAVGVAQFVFPDLPWPTTDAMAESNQELWALIKRKVYTHLGIGPGLKLA